MALKVYVKTLLTGGTTNAVDGIDGADLSGNELCFVGSTGASYLYKCTTASTAAESSPGIIAPDDNASSKRWVLHTPVAPVETSTAAGYISARGLSVLRPGVNAVFKLPAPSVKGIQKEVVFASTYVVKLKTTAASINFGSTLRTVISVTNSTTTAKIGYGMIFRSVSSAVWRTISRSTALSTFSSST